MAENTELEQNVSEAPQALETESSPGSNFDSLMAAGTPAPSGPGPGGPPSMSQVAASLHPTAAPANDFDQQMRAGQYAVQFDNERKKQRSAYDKMTYEDAAPLHYIDADSIANFTMQENYNPMGFNPDDPSNYARAAAKETWGTALMKGIDTMKANFGSSYVDNFVGYKRIGEAIMDMDFSKLEKTPEESMQIYYENQKDAQKNFVFDTPEGRDSIFSKSSMADFIGSTGYALGTFGAISTEIVADLLITAATEGAGIETLAVPFAKIGALFGRTAAKEGVKEGIEIGAKEAVKTAAEQGLEKSGALKEFGQGFSLGNKSVEEIRMLKKVDEAAAIANTSKTALKDAINETFNVFNLNLPRVLKSKSVGELVTNAAKGTPLLGNIIRSGEKINAGIEAGLSTSKLFGMGLQGLRRTAQELNMSATEASFEAVTSYGDTLNKLIEDHKANNEGAIPSEQQFEKMRQTALSASSANFKTNMAVLMVSNQLEFGNIFNRFTSSSVLTRELMEATKDSLLVVEKNGMKKMYEKGFAGAYGLSGQIAKDFGKKEATYQMGKAFFKNMGKFEIIEGLQENVQDISAQGWKDYYVGQYEKSKTTLDSAFGKAMQAEIGNQGIKTFLMGALTGTIIRLPTHIVTKTIEAANNRVMDSVYKNDPDGNPVRNAQKQFTENVNTLNAFFKSAEERDFKHKIVNFTTQVQEGQNATEASAKKLEYEFHNSRDNAMTSAIIAAKRTETFDVLLRSIKEMGHEMTNEDFEKSFGVKLEDTKYTSPREFSESLARDVKKYSDTVDGIKQNVKGFAEPYLYTPGSKEQYAAKMLLNAQEDAIHLIGMNAIKGNMSATRAKEITQKLLSNEHISNSSDFAVRVLTNPEVLIGEMGNVKSEIKQITETLSQSGLDQKVKQQLTEELGQKQEELKLINQWHGFFSSKEQVTLGVNDKGEIETQTNIVPDTFIGKTIDGKQTIKDENGEELDTTEQTFDTHHSEVVETLRNLLNIKNKQAGSKVKIGEAEIRDVHQKLVDYMKLDSDTKDYMSAVDTLMNPENFKHTQSKMASGKMKFHVLAFIDQFDSYLLSGMFDIQEELQKSGITLNGSDFVSLQFEIQDYVHASEPYKNIVTFSLDPNLNIHNSAYLDTLKKDLLGIVNLKMAEISKRFQPKEYNEDITSDEFDEIIATGEINPIRLNLLADKIAKGASNLGPNENKLIENEKFKPIIDAAVENAKENLLPDEKPKTENYTFEDSNGLWGVADPNDKTIVEGYTTEQEALDAAQAIIEQQTQVSNKNVVPTGNKPDLPIMNKSMDELQKELDQIDDEISEAEAQGFDSTVENLTIQRENIVFAMDQKNAVPEAPEAPVVNQPAPVKSNEVVTADNEPSLPDDTAAILALMDTMNGNENREETFVVEANDGETFDVKDKAEHVVTTVPTEDAAQAVADSLNNTRKDVDFTQKFIEDAITTDEQKSEIGSLINQMNTRGERSMKMYNKQKGTEFKTLEEFYKTADGRSKLLGIRESVITGKAVKRPSKKKVVVSEDTVTQPTLFETMFRTDNVTARQDVLKLLDQQLKEIKDTTKKQEAPESSEKNTKFVVEDAVTESSILQQLKDATNCFK